MKTHKYPVDTTVFFNYAFPILDNEFDTDIDDAPNRFILDQESMLLREDLLPDNDNFDPLG